MYFPRELWRTIKDYQIDYKKHHWRKYKPLIKYFNGRYSEIFSRWTFFPPSNNTNDMQNEFEYYRPTPNLELTTICWNIKGSGGWWCGYGWRTNHHL